MTMQAVRLYAKGDLRVEQVARPGPLAADDVRVAVSHAGICGSDLHNFKTGQWISRSPSIAGHEVSGTVVEAGPDVQGLAVGDRVAADSRFWCGTCPACRKSQRHLCEALGFIGEACDGGFAEEMVLPARLLHPVPPQLSSRLAATAEPLAVALHAVRRLRLTPGEPVLIAGCGPIGGFAAVILKHLHDGPVVVADRNDARAARVREATGAAVATALTPEAVSAASGGRRITAAIDATGSIAALAACLACLSPGGALALVGISHGTLEIDPNHLVERELALLGCHAFQDELPDAIALLPAYGAMITALLDREITLAEVPAAYARLIAGTTPGLKTLIRISP
jgi:(R,R)-butanediol dehydrogenase/meso-butanediol dehydrogenase/diacetyl reductase